MYLPNRSSVYDTYRSCGKLRSPSHPRGFSFPVLISVKLENGPSPPLRL